MHRRRHMAPVPGKKYYVSIPQTKTLEVFSYPDGIDGPQVSTIENVENVTYTSTIEDGHIHVKQAYTHRGDKASQEVKHSFNLNDVTDRDTVVFSINGNKQDSING